MALQAGTNDGIPVRAQITVVSLLNSWHPAPSGRLGQPGTDRHGGSESDRGSDSGGHWHRDTVTGCWPGQARTGAGLSGGINSQHLLEVPSDTVLGQQCRRAGR